MGLYPKPILEYLALAGIPRGHNSRIFIVDPKYGSDTNTGDRWNQPLAKVSTAYDMCTANRHDVVLLVGHQHATGTASDETAAIDWAKNDTHLVGLCAGGHASQRSRITCGADGLTPFFTVSGSNCIIKDVTIWQGRAHATTLLNVKVTGQRNRFSNVHFAGGGHATQAVDGGASLVLGDGCAENLFEGCTIGVDTVAASTGLAGLLFDGTAGTCARNRFKECLFTLYAAGTTPAGVRQVEIAGNGSIDRYTEFDRCRFYNQGTAMTAAFVFGSGMDAANKRIYLYDSALDGSTDWEAGTSGILFCNRGTITAGGNAGLFAATNAT